MYKKARIWNVMVICNLSDSILSLGSNVCLFFEDNIVLLLANKLIEILWFRCCCKLKQLSCYNEKEKTTFFLLVSLYWAHQQLEIWEEAGTQPGKRVQYSVYETPTDRQRKKLVSEKRLFLEPKPQSVVAWFRCLLFLSQCCPLP